MRTLASGSSVLLLLGGALMTVLLLVMTAVPESPAIYGFFVVAPVIGLGVLGSMVAAGDAVGRAGRLAAWASAVAGVAVVGVGGYAIATGQFSTSAGIGGDDPLAVPFAATSMLWMIGSLGFVLALVRRRAVPQAGAWLVLVGVVLAIGLGTILGSIAPQLAPLAALPFGLGWAVVGQSARAGA